mgnify:CR=1 FL=1
MEHRGRRPGASDMALVDVGTVLGLQRRLGHQRCQEMVEEAIYGVTDRVARAEKALDRDVPIMALNYARELEEMCLQIGLSRMGQVASDLIDTLEREDSVAANAIMARLVRLAEEALFCLVTLDSEGGA